MEMIDMKFNLPNWAKKKVNPTHHGFDDVKRLHIEGKTQIQLPDLDELKNWSKLHGWPRPWFGFKKSFVTKMFESPETFSMGLSAGIVLHIPIKQHTFTSQDMAELDALYYDREDMGALGQRPVSWGSLVERLREIRRLVEAGVEVHIDDKVLTTWQSFYSWAHGRYHALEDGYDSWIGDDDT
ncbi:MAG: hypothetical protein KDC35_02820 [Acidobacteria bacterium]|nr:hypothetical protein [Acidobacteriota bacterium]